MSEGRRTHSAIRDCGYFLSVCLRYGWRRSDLDALEVLWWKYHDNTGKLIGGPLAAAVSRLPPPVLPALTAALDAHPRCDCGAPVTTCAACAVADYQAAHVECATCCPPHVAAARLPRQPATQPEFCICAAVRLEDGRVIRGHRHDDCIQTAVKWKDAGQNIGPLYQEQQGFVTSRGRFVGRKAAADLERNVGRTVGELLFSEDLY